MPDTPNQSDVDHQQPHEPTDPQTLADETEFTNLITAMVANHAPRMFAIVLKRGERLDAAITAWGLALDNSAYAVTTDGKTQYLLAAPEQALQYVRRTANTTPHLVWVDPTAATPSEPTDLSRVKFLAQFSVVESCVC
jgi:hypothetical protein